MPTKTTTEVVSISRRKFIELIYAQQGSNRSFRVDTIRRHAKTMSDGTVSLERKFVAQFDVECFKRGGPMAYDPESKGLFWVCDMLVTRQIRHYEKSGKPIPPHLKKDLRSPYRAVNMDGLLGGKIRGTEYKVTTS